MSARKFVKVYRELSNEYPAIYDDAEALGTYVQLLMLCDAMYDAHPQLPRSVGDRALDALTTAGLVIVEDHDRYTIKGYDKQREAEAEQGRRDAERRWAKRRDGYPNGYPIGTPYATRPDQTRPDQTKLSRARAPEGGAPRESGTETSGVSPWLKVDTGLEHLASVAIPATTNGDTDGAPGAIEVDKDGQYVYVPPATE